MSDELRDRLASLLDWLDDEPLDSGTRFGVVDEVLAEIKAAGYVLVDRERWQRVAGRAEWSLDPWQYMGDEPIPTLQLGDLDPLPEVGE